jgi:hypothetical protein
MPIPVTLFDLFGEFTSLWPLSVIQRMVGILGPGSSDPDLRTWLAALNNSAIVTDVRTGADADRVSVEAKLQFDNGLAGFPAGFPLVLSSMPDVEFRVQTITDPGKFFQLFVSVAESGVELVLEGLPVEIRLPPGLIQPHPNPTEHLPNLAEAVVGEFIAGEHDRLRIEYRRDGPTSVLVHVRVHLTEDNEISIRSAVPITFGRCLFSEVPCLALHDFTLIPSPSLVETNVEWIRHSVKPWAPEHVGPRDGLFAIRSVSIDSEQPPFKGIADKLNESSTREPDAEFVLDDLVVPFFSPWVVPIPRHVTLGIRRRVLQADDERAVFQFERAPVLVFFDKDKGFIVESLFYKSLPAEDLSRDLGLTFAAAIFFGEEESAQHAFEIGLGENYTVTLGYRRDFSSSTGMPTPGEGAASTINALLHWEIVTVVIDIMALRAGYSLGRAIGEGKDFGDCFELTADLFVSAPPSGSDDSLIFRMRTLDGEKVAFAIEGIGWRQGSFHFEGLALPDGVAIFIWKFALILQEIGLRVESGASYLSFSGGLVFPLPSGSEGGITVKRLRFRVAGNPDTPKVKLDGFFILLKLGTLLISAGGFYSETKVGDVQVNEIGMLGRVEFEVATVKYMFSLEVLAGDLKSPNEAFEYLMCQVAFKGSVIVAWFELRGARVLFARNMQPKLSAGDRDSRELRYYKWFRDNQNSVDIPDDRRLTSWQPKKDAWALGIGASASLAALGKVVELSTFVLVVSGDDEHGWLVVAEVLLLQSPNPVGFAAIQWDGKNDRFSLLAGVNLSPANFLKSIPAWVNRIGKLSGTLFIGNNPTTVAIGKLSDTRTWFSITFDINLWVKTFIRFGFCFEYVKNGDGPTGVGLIVRLEGGVNARIVRVTYVAEFGLLALAFQTGSSDYAAAIWIELALRIVLFGFLRFGISARGELRTVGTHPSRGELRVQIHLETPWYLPDVTWTFEINFGNLIPEDLATAVTPLRSSSANDEGRQKIQAVHVERIDQTWDGEGVAQTFSINQVRGISLAESDRLARFEANTGVKPVATTSRVALEFSVAVNDLLALDNNAAPGLGIQKSGELSLRYDLIGLSIRRRSRFGVDRSWRQLDQIVELGADFSDPQGVGLSGAFTKPSLTMFWDMAVQIEGRTATKKLLINAKTPFEYQTQNAEIDEEVVRDNPAWPCCPPRGRGRFPKLHEVMFREEQAGADILGDRLFTESQSRLQFVPRAYAFPQEFSTTLPAGALVALMTLRHPGPVFRADFDEEVAFCLFTLRWTISSRKLLLLAFDEESNEIGRKEVPPSFDFQDVVLAATGPIRRIEARFMGQQNDGLRISASAVSNPGGPAFALDRVAYIGLRSYLDYLISLESCNRLDPGFTDGYAGHGAVSFLPNHDYEIAVTTKLTITHPSKASESANATEYVYFKTKGLPGLNAVATVGEEIAPFVTSAYAGGKGALYREEPVAVSFKEDFHVVVPLVLRPSGTSEERTVLMRMQLVVRPDDTPTLDTPFTETAPDWIVTNRSLVAFDPRNFTVALVSKAQTIGTRGVSDDPFRGRLATITQRPAAGCELADPRQVVNTALVAPPQGTTDPNDPTLELWPAGLPFTAIVKLEGSGFVNREAFVPADLTAFDLALDRGPGAPLAWEVIDGQIRVADGSERRFAIFGEPDWNHLTIECSFSLDGSMAGVGVGLPAGDLPARGLFAVIQRSGSGRRLVIFRRRAGNEFTEEAQAALVDSTDPTVPMSLVVTAFDDRLRASVGEIAIEVERDQQREGRFCLIAVGAATFTALRVTGLELYTFPFKPSRFRSFGDHINSFTGVFDVILPDALGPGTTTSTTTELVNSPDTAIASVMLPNADPAKRQIVFDRWVAALGLPLKDDVTSLEISRFERSGGTEFLLIESPEPLDFTEEITLRLDHRVTPEPPPFDVHVDLNDVFETRPRIPRNPFERRQQIHRLAREEVLQFAQTRKTDVVTNVTSKAVGGRPFLLNVDKEADVLHVEIDLEALAEPLAPGSPLHFAEAVGEGADRRVRFFTGSVPLRNRRGVTTVTARLTDEIAGAQTGNSPIMLNKLENLESGVIVALNPALDGILGGFLPHFLFLPIHTKILQDATGHRAIVVPFENSAPQSLGPGSYRLMFEISRHRWDTTDPADELNLYDRTALIRMKI